MIAVVVLPTPPFWFVIAMVRALLIIPRLSAIVFWNFIIFTIITYWDWIAKKKAVFHVKHCINFLFYIVSRETLPFYFALTAEGNTFFFSADEAYT